MGYYMDQIEADFEIKHDLQEKALEAIKNLASGSDSPRHLHYAWVNDGEYCDAKDLDTAMDAWRWHVERNEDGDIDYISFEGEKLGDDEILFNAIAPYVTQGSYIQMSGEEGCIWRWVFDGEKCAEIYPKIEWGEI